MKPRRIILLVLIAALVALGFFIWPETEPRNHGRTLSEWVIATKGQGPIPIISGRQIAMNRPYPGTSLPGVAASNSQGGSPEDALRQIGTNALPYLARWIRYETPWWKTKLRRGFDYLPEKLRPRSLNSELKVDRANACPAAFAILGQQSAAAVPELCRALDRPYIITNSPYAMQRIRLAFQMLGSNVFPEVEQLLTNRANPHRLGAANALAAMRKDAQTGPMLIACLQDSNPFVSEVAARSLGDIRLVDAGPADKVVVTFTNVLRQGTPWVRERTALALGRLGMYRHDFDPAWEKLPLPALTNALTDLSLPVREAATNAINWWTDADGTNFVAASYTYFGASPTQVLMPTGPIFRPPTIGTSSVTNVFSLPRTGSSDLNEILRRKTAPRTNREADDKKMETKR